MTPGSADQLAATFRAAFGSSGGKIAEYAVKVTASFDRVTALNAYAALIDELLVSPKRAKKR